MSKLSGKLSTVSASRVYPNTPETDRHPTVLCEVRLSNGTSLLLEAADPYEVMDRVLRQLNPAIPVPFARKFSRKREIPIPVQLRNLGRPLVQVGGQCSLSETISTGFETVRFAAPGSTSSMM